MKALTCSGLSKTQSSRTTHTSVVCSLNLSSSGTGNRHWQVNFGVTSLACNFRKAFVACFSLRRDDTRHGVVNMCPTARDSKIVWRVSFYLACNFRKASLRVPACAWRGLASSCRHRTRHFSSRWQHDKPVGHSG